MMSTPAAAEDFDSAVAALYSQLHQSTTLAALNAAAARRTNTIHDMHTYLHRLGLELNNTAHDDERSNHHLASSTQSSCNHTPPPLIIHITGTKGKGSTLSYCESLLRNTYGLTTGMFTSPHLVCIRERIRINGIPVSKKVFAEVYWTVRRTLEENSHVMLPQQQHLNDASDDNDDDDDGNSSQGNVQELLPPLPTLPGYFRMLTLMALYTFTHHDSPKVDAILLEVGMGGRYDATNVFEPHNNNNNNGRILVRGITLIDYDHTRVLGSTLEQIAWEKGGIFVSDKRGKIHGNDGGYDKFLIGHEEQQQQQEEEEYEDEEGIGYNNPLFVNGSNTPQVANVLRTIARQEKESSLQLVQESYLDSIPGLNFHASHQRGNAALALAVCQHAISQYQKQQHCYYRTTLSNNGNVTKEQISAALNNTFWPGRCHTLTLPSSNNDNEDEVSLKLRCDGAHTPISINACINWFQSILTTYSEATTDYESVHKVLIFNCGHERNPIPLLHTLHQSGLFDRVYFSRADFERPSAMPKQLLDEWRKEEILTIAEPTSGEECAVNYGVMCNTLKELGMTTTSSHAAEGDGMTKRTWQHTLASIWKVLDLYHSSQVMEEKSHPSTNDVDSKKVVVGLKVVDAIEDIKKQQQEAQREVNGGKKASVEIFVTGSLYLVGSALEAVGWEEGESEGRLSIH
eukprot:scaffold16767_cov149-Skeletonema_dohrnii-CCMP3373.AAC.5